MVSGVDFRSWPQTDEHPEIETGSQPQTGLAFRKGLTARRKRPRLRSVPQPKPRLEHTNKSRTGSPRRCFSVKAPMLKNHRPNAIAEMPPLKRHHRNPTQKRRQSGKGLAAFDPVSALFSGANSRPQKRPHRTVFRAWLLSKQERNRRCFQGGGAAGGQVAAAAEKGINAGAVSAVH